MRLAATAAATAAAALLALTGCGTGGYSEGGSTSAGKQLFEQRCKSCHALADAGGGGRIGPNLDDAFAQARADGMTEATFTQVVRDQIRYPITKTSTGAPGMPPIDETLPECGEVEEGAFCVEDQLQAAEDIAAYVASVAGTGKAPTPPPPGGEVSGKQVFLANCGACHTLADAGTTGTVGPNLDQARPSKGLALDRVTNGKGQMPSFKGTLSDEQIQAVAEYVARAAGR
ncbi:MAG TPA: c-type cytochrome [Gaiellaceae bacterium]|nr:c-type cytochrome [Gaiellaceae bacterium]